MQPQKKVPRRPQRLTPRQKKAHDKRVAEQAKQPPPKPRPKPPSEPW